MKLKHIAAALVLAAAGPASANLILPGTGNSELIFVIRDNGAADPTSYVLDLGVQMDSFLSLGQSDGGYHSEWNINDANFLSFLGTTDSSRYEWAVIGGDTTGGTQAGGVRLVTTAAAGTPLDIIDNTTNQLMGLAAASTSINSFYQSVNQTGTHDDAGVVNGSSVNLASDQGATYFGEGSSGPNMGVVTYLYNVTNAVGASSNFYSLVRTGPLQGNPAAVDTFDNTAGVGTFTLNRDLATGAYQLVYDIPAVPEPGSLALVLAGFTAMGFVGRRRSRR